MFETLSARTRSALRHGAEGEVRLRGEVAAGRHRKFHTGRVRSDRPAKAGRCTDVYWLGDLPRELIDAYGDTLAFDLRPDLALHLSPDEGNVPDLTLEARKGFPRRAVARSCA